MWTRRRLRSPRHPRHRHSRGSLWRPGPFRGKRPSQNWVMALRSDGGASGSSGPRGSIRREGSIPFSRMTPRISELSTHVGSAVTVRGWVAHLRSSGKIAFAVIRDGTGVAQAVMVKTQLPPEVWERFAELTLETSVAVTGEVRAEPRAPGGYELGVTSLEIVGPSPTDYPIQPK